jgi:hypothetical protein
MVPALVLCLVGCKKERQVDATKPLEQSFQSAGPEVQQAIATVNASLKTKDFEAATKALVPLVSGRAMTDAQRTAVGLALQQINQAVAANPSLDTKEMYQLRRQIFQAADSAPRL